MKDKTSHPLDTSRLTDEEFNLEILKGYQDVLEGRVQPASVVFDKILNRVDYE